MGLGLTAGSEQGIPTLMDQLVKPFVLSNVGIKRTAKSKSAWTSITATK
jgi:hypothetical protein